MKPVIIQALKELERDKNITLLYACESGSRAWDFASGDSDWDVRFIYKRPIAAYVTLSPPRDVVELPLEHKLDINGWDVHKALQLAGKSNPALMEWLFSPITYLEQGSFAAEMRKYISQQYSPRAIAYHYLHMAEGNYHKYLSNQSSVQRKKYLYVLRPLFCMEWLGQQKSMPPTRFLDVLGGVKTTKELRNAIQRLLEEKARGKEVGRGPREEVLDRYIQSRIQQFKGKLEMFVTKEANYVMLDSILQRELLS